MQKFKVFSSQAEAQNYCANPDIGQAAHGVLCTIRIATLQEGYSSMTKNVEEIHQNVACKGGLYLYGEFE